MLTNRIFNWAERTPDRTAVVYNGKPWAYRSFAQRIAVARGYFARRGYVGPGYAVLVVYNLLDFWILGLALRSLGLTTMAVPSVLVGELRLPAVRCVVAGASESHPGLDRKCAELGLRLLSVSLDGEARLDLDEAPPHFPGDHILLTSGTTGVHKMVLIDPAIEAEYLRQRREIMGISQASVYNVFNFAGWTGVGYLAPAGVWEVGGGVVIQQEGAPHQALLHPGITHSVVVPPMLNAILAAPERAFPRNEAMQLNIVGGAVTQSQIDQAKVRITPRLYSGIGATETNILTRTPLDDPEDRQWHQPVPGRVVEVVDGFDQPAAVGQVGRIRVSTEGGPTGYLHDEEATRAFFKDGFFYTGDLAVMRADGRFALQGRFTDVINMNGDKCSPAPIEDDLGAALGVSGVCLFTLVDVNGEEELNVVIEAQSAINTERLASVLRQRLRGFPHARVHYASALPRNHMGKIRRQEVKAFLQAISSRRPV